MENYQTLFTAAASSTSLMPSPFSSNYMTNSHAFTHSIDGKNGNGVLVSKPGLLTQIPHSFGDRRVIESGNFDGSQNNVKSAGKKEGAKKMKKHRYAFQTRSQVDVLDDGYRWRKYGQKAVKNNKFPRSYYRCTQPGCNVKKQVQRLSKDEDFVVTTYEGIHTHAIETSTHNFEHIFRQIQTYSPHL